MTASEAVVTVFATASGGDSGHGIGGLLFLLMLLFLYFLPALIANHRKHHNQLAIFVLNLVVGWTVLGWIIALVWAFTNPQRNSAKSNAAV